MTITIFTINAGKNGEGTLQFKNVSNILNAEPSLSSRLEFDYVSASTGHKAHAVFFKDTISGFSIKDEENE